MTTTTVSPFPSCPDGRVPGTCRTAALDRVARTVTLGLHRVSADIAGSDYSSTPDPAEHARRAERLHQLYTRRARWWAVLERATLTDTTIPTAYLWALVHARLAAHQDADAWAERATWWHHRAHGHDGDSSALAERAVGPAVHGVVA